MTALNPVVEKVPVRMFTGVDIPGAENIIKKRGLRTPVDCLSKT